MIVMSVKMSLKIIIDQSGNLIVLHKLYSHPIHTAKFS